MDKKEMKEKWLVLYNEIIESGEEDKMAVLGSMVKRMMSWFVDNESDIAQECLDMLEAVRWNNYLTQRESDKIINRMQPRPEFSPSQIKETLTNMGYELESKPYYNKYALLTAVSMKLSDSGQTIKKLIKSTDSQLLIEAAYNLAIDSLTDEDGIFSIRKYFNL